jgi:hypothetical protein
LTVENKSIQEEDIMKEKCITLLTLSTVLLFAISALAADKVVVVPLTGKSDGYFWGCQENIPQWSSGQCSRDCWNYLIGDPDAQGPPCFDICLALSNTIHSGPGGDLSAHICLSGKNE